MRSRTVPENPYTPTTPDEQFVPDRLTKMLESGMSDSFRIRTREAPGPVLVLSGSVLSHWVFCEMESHYLGSSANWNNLHLVSYPSWSNIDITSFEVEAGRQSEAAFQDLDRYHFEHELLGAFEAEVVEDGMYHPAEDIIIGAFDNHDEAKVLGWISELVLDASRPDFAYSILLCLTHQQPPGTSSWRTYLISSALDSQDIVVRDAAVQVAESWADPALLPTLRATETNEPVNWLKHHIAHVIECIQTTPSVTADVSCS